MSALGGYCCKSRFALGVGKSAGCRCDFHVKMRGASSPHVKLTSDFANTSEAIRIGDASRLIVSRKIRHSAIFDFCNTIGANRTRRDGENDVNDPNRALAIAQFLVVLGRALTRTFSTTPSQKFQPFSRIPASLALTGKDCSKHRHWDTAAW
jgi:hypothetical protein